MRRILVVISILCIFASFVPLTVQAAAGYSTDFESFAGGTLAGALTVPGITFVSNSGDWQIYAGFTRPPNVIGNALGSFAGTLTMNFATLQGTVQFGYSSCADFVVTGYRNGAVVQTLNVPNTACDGNALTALQDPSGFDSVVINSTDGIIIDFLVTTGIDTVSSCLIPPLDNAVVGRFTSAGTVFWEPGKQTEPVVTIGVGESAWVYGVDESGKYYKIAWSCQTRWVPVESMGPNFDNVWQGRSLPTTVVS